MFALLSPATSEVCVEDESDSALDVKAVVARLFLGLLDNLVPVYLKCLFQNFCHCHHLKSLLLFH